MWFRSRKQLEWKYLLKTHKIFITLRILLLLHIWLWHLHLWIQQCFIKLNKVSSDDGQWQIILTLSAVDVQTASLSLVVWDAKMFNYSSVKLKVKVCISSFIFYLIYFPLFRKRQHPNVFASDHFSSVLQFSLPEILIWGGEPSGSNYLFTSNIWRKIIKMKKKIVVGDGNGKDFTAVRHVTWNLGQFAKSTPDGC